MSRRALAKALTKPPLSPPQNKKASSSQAAKQPGAAADGYDDVISFPALSVTWDNSTDNKPVNYVQIAPDGTLTASTHRPRGGILRELCAKDNVYPLMFMAPPIALQRPFFFLEYEPGRPNRWLERQSAHVKAALRSRTWRGREQYGEPPPIEGALHVLFEPMTQPHRKFKQDFLDKFFTI